MPNVISQEVGTATQLLDDKGFDVDIKPVPSTAPRDTVTEQDPIPGEKVDEGSTVILTISSGPAIGRRSPMSRGSPRPTPPSASGGLGLLVDPEFNFSDTIPEGRVIGTDPGRGDLASTPARP